MAATNFTPISLYYSATAAAVPLAANLVAGELALNTVDGKLYYKSFAGAVTLLAGATAGPAGGSNTQVQFNSSGALAGSSNLTWSGTGLAVTGTLSATGVATFSAGSAALPAITTTGDTNTGMWFPAADTIAFTEGGVESMRIDSSGNLGIGTTSPKAPLHVVASAGAANDKTLIIQDKTAGNAGEAWLSFKAQESLDDERIKGAIVYANSGSAYGVGNLLFCMNSTADNSNVTTANEKMRLDSSGNLGIGTTAPQNKLQVATTTRPQFSVSYNGTTGLYLEDATNSSWKSWKLSTSFGAGSDLSFVQSTNTSGTPTWAATAAMTLDADGDLGIGQTSPAFKLDVQVAVGGAIAVRPSTATGNAKQSALRLYGSDSVTASRYAEVACFNDTAGTDTNALTFSTGYGATIYERARISSDGNLVVGQTSQGTIGSNSSFGAYNAGYIGVSSTGDSVFSRRSTNGDVVTFRRDTSSVGAIAVTTTGVTLTGTNGITFTAAQTASADANTLDDYEEGSWTPDLTSSGTPISATIVSAGRYTKIGNAVVIYGYVSVTAVTSATGTYLRVTGLPFSFATFGGGGLEGLTSGSFGPYGEFTGLSASDNLSIGASSSTEINIWKTSGNGSYGTGLSGANIQATTSFYFSIVGKVA